MNISVTDRVRKGDKLEVGIGRGYDRIIACSVEHQLHAQASTISSVQSTMRRIGIDPSILKVETVQVFRTGVRRVGQRRIMIATKLPQTNQSTHQRRRRVSVLHLLVNATADTEAKGTETVEGIIEMSGCTTVTELASKDHSLEVLQSVRKTKIDVS